VFVWRHCRRRLPASPCVSSVASGVWVDGSCTLRDATQAWLFRNAATRCAVVAFRGTEQAKWKDLLTDVRLRPSAFNPERVAATPGLGAAVLTNVLDQVSRCQTALPGRIGSRVRTAVWRQRRLAGVGR
jgi:hypothetical protein